MRFALIDGQLTPAGPDGSAELAEVAPPAAVCPDCGHPVTLRQRLGTWHWRHVHGTPLDCPARFNAHSNGKGKATADGGLTTADTGEAVNVVRPRRCRSGMLRKQAHDAVARQVPRQVLRQVLRQAQDSAQDGAQDDAQGSAQDAALVEKLEEVREMLKGVDAERVWILCGVRGVDGGLFLMTCFPDGDGDFNAKAQGRNPSLTLRTLRRGAEK